MAAPEPAIAPRMPSALFRSAPSRNVTSVMEKTDGARIAPAAPWTRRIAMSIPEETERPQRSEEIAKSGEPDHEELPTPEQVAHAAPEQQEAAEGERIAADDPLEVLGREVELLLDRRKRDVHDRDVENDHQVGDSEDGERLPTLRVRGGVDRHAGLLSVALGLGY